MSGDAAESMMRQRVLESGVHFPQTPFTPGLLGRKVRKVLDGNGP